MLLRSAKLEASTGGRSRSRSRSRRRPARCSRRSPRSCSRARSRARSGASRRRAAQLAAGERPEPLPVTGSDEVAALATAFNQMAEELDRAKDAERSFLLSVSHELKTPLVRDPRPRRGAARRRDRARRRSARSSSPEAKRLERLVRDLLDLARLNQRVVRGHAAARRPGRSSPREAVGAARGRGARASASRSSPTRPAPRRRPPIPTACSRCSRT